MPITRALRTPAIALAVVAAVPAGLIGLYKGLDILTDYVLLPAMSAVADGADIMHNELRCKPAGIECRRR